MFEVKNKSDVEEASKPEAEGYKEIKPEGQHLLEQVKSFWDDLFAANDKETSESGETREKDNSEENLEKTLEDYFNDLKDKSEYPETIPDKPFKASDLKKRTPEENAEMRDEFAEKKAQLKNKWEEENGRPWPKYEHDVYSSNGKLIRKAGSDYDVHHIQPLSMGGKNEVGNITPLNAEVHYDKQGVHALDSPYSKLEKMLGGAD